jgi:hypothetical protein
MASRSFTDRSGAAWRVWSTVPQDTRGCLPGYEQGWLTFENEGTAERRRLAPIPDDWEEVSEERLILMCRVAEAPRVGRFSSPPGGMPALPGGAEDERGG